jgi:hypothetical protein
MDRDGLGWISGYLRTYMVQGREKSEIEGPFASRITPPHSPSTITSLNTGTAKRTHVNRHSVGAGLRAPSSTNQLVPRRDRHAILMLR